MIDGQGLLRNEKAGPPQEKHTRQGDDEGGDLQGVDEPAHEGAEACSQHQHQGDGQHGADPQLPDELGQQHAGEGDDGPHRQIYAAREDDEGHAHRDYAKEGVVRQYVADDAGGHEGREGGQAEQIAQHEDHDGHRQGQVAFKHGDSLAGTGG